MSTICSINHYLWSLGHVPLNMPLVSVKPEAIFTYGPQQRKNHFCRSFFLYFERPLCCSCLTIAKMTGKRYHRPADCTVSTFAICSGAWVPDTKTSCAPTSSTVFAWRSAASVTSTRQELYGWTLGLMSRSLSLITRPHEAGQNQRTRSCPRWAVVTSQSTSRWRQ